MVIGYWIHWIWKHWILDIEYWILKIGHLILEATVPGLFFFLFFFLFLFLFLCSISYYLLYRTTTYFSLKKKKQFFRIFFQFLQKPQKPNLFEFSSYFCKNDKNKTKKKQRKKNPSSGLLWLVFRSLYFSFFRNKKKKECLPFVFAFLLLFCFLKEIERIKV